MTRAGKRLRLSVEGIPAKPSLGLIKYAEKVISTWNFGSKLDINGMIIIQSETHEVIKHLDLDGYLVFFRTSIYGAGGYERSLLTQTFHAAKPLYNMEPLTAIEKVSNALDVSVGELLT